MTQTYVVVGASSGIGFEIAKSLISSGNEVITLSRRTPELNGNTHYTIDIIEEELDAIPVPENLAGVVYAPGSINLKPFRGLKTSDFQNDLNVNFFGAIKVLKWAQKALTTNPVSSVVLFSTVAVKQGMPFHASIAAAKGAIEGLTRSLAAEWAPKVRVNCIAPSLTDTPLAERLLNNEKKQEASALRHPLHRVGSSSDIAKAALYLLSNDSSWVTGQVLGVDGGLSALKLS